MAVFSNFPKLGVAHVLGVTELFMQLPSAQSTSGHHDDISITKG